MTKDIVERLREATPYGLEDAFVLRDAAFEIDRLRAIIDRTEGALAAALDVSNCWPAYREARSILEEAKGEK